MCKNMWYITGLRDGGEIPPDDSSSHADIPQTSDAAPHVLTIICDVVLHVLTIITLIILQAKSMFVIMLFILHLIIFTIILTIQLYGCNPHPGTLQTAALPTRGPCRILAENLPWITNQAVKDQRRSCHVQSRSQGLETGIAPTETEAQKLDEHREDQSSSADAGAESEKVPFGIYAKIRAPPALILPQDETCKTGESPNKDPKVKSMKGYFQTFCCSICVDDAESYKVHALRIFWRTGRSNNFRLAMLLRLC